MDYSKEVDRLLLNIKRLERDSTFTKEIEILIEIVTPTVEDIIEICKLE